MLEKDSGAVISKRCTLLLGADPCDRGQRSKIVLRRDREDFLGDLP